MTRGMANRLARLEGRQRVATDAGPRFDLSGLTDDELETLARLLPVGEEGWSEDERRTVDGILAKAPQLGTGA